ncbi:unnamed protein product [Adineta ricciae]|uniref:Uncharacterized protein n=1 Tax=Adineta ricciae TaxID=249248 RepID=A0A814XW91_ADIRI|nr:unnamed protein product [Adineta ricciae]
MCISVKTKFLVLLLFAGSFTMIKAASLARVRDVWGNQYYAWVSDTGFGGNGGSSSWSVIGTGGAGGWGGSL